MRPARAPARRDRVQREGIRGGVGSVFAWEEGVGWAMLADIFYSNLVMMSSGSLLLFALFALFAWFVWFAGFALERDYVFPWPEIHRFSSVSIGSKVSLTHQQQTSS